MSIDQEIEHSQSTKILNFPLKMRFRDNQNNPEMLDKQQTDFETPIYSASIAERDRMNLISRYKSDFDFLGVRNLEKRFKEKTPRGGILLKTAFRLVNAHSTCQQCLYAFEIDTYGRGCLHNCAYCYAKAELTVHGYWNNPMPFPVDINEIRKQFYIAFETDKKGKWANLLRRRIPLRIGSMSDSFMWTDKQIKVTQEFLRILKFYRYPYVVFTRSDLVAEDEYIDLLDPELASIQFSLSSVNEALVRKIEPGASSPIRRINACKKLVEAGFWTTFRLNPLFPIHPDGFYSDPNFKWVGNVPKFEFSSFDMVDAVAESKTQAILTGFARLSSLSMNAIEKATGENLRQYYRRDLVNKSVRDFHFSDKEIQFYYREIKKRCDKHSIQFTTCYIGNGEGHFWADQDMWSNKKDCCNISGRVEAFQRNSREISFEDRVKYSNNKLAKPLSNDLHTPL